MNAPLSGDRVLSMEPNPAGLPEPQVAQQNPFGRQPSSRLASVVSAACLLWQHSRMVCDPGGQAIAGAAQADVSEALDKFADGQLSADDFIAAMRDMGVEVCDSKATSSYGSMVRRAR